MSLYSKKLSKDIKHFQESISRNNKSIKILKEELLTGENVFSYKAHILRISILHCLNTRLEHNLEETKRLVF